MPFKVTVEEITTAQDETLPSSIKRYEQTVDAINLRAVMAAVNQVPRKSRAKKERTDA